MIRQWIIHVYGIWYNFTTEYTEKSYDNKYDKDFTKIYDLLMHGAVNAGSKIMAVIEVHWNKQWNSYSMFIFRQILTRGTWKLAREGEMWGFFCEFKAWSMFYFLPLLCCMKSYVVLDHESPHYTKNRQHNTNDGPPLQTFMKQGPQFPRKLHHHSYVVITSKRRLCVVLPHDDVIKRKHFPRYWPFVRGIHRLPVNSTHRGQWRITLMFYLICAWIDGWVYNLETGDLRRHSAHYDVTAMLALEIVTSTPYRSSPRALGPKVFTNIM